MRSYEDAAFDQERVVSVTDELDRKAADFLAGRWGHLTTEEIETFRETVAESPDEKAKKRILQVVAQAGREGISRNELTRKTQFLRKQFRDEYLDDLVEGGELRMGTNSKGGVVYYPEL